MWETRPALGNHRVGREETNESFRSSLPVSGLYRRYNTACACIYQAFYVLTMSATKLRT